MLNPAEQEILPANKSTLMKSSVVFLLILAAYEIFSAKEFETAYISWHFHIYQQREYHAQLLCARKSSITSGPDQTSIMCRLF